MRIANGSFLVFAAGLSLGGCSGSGNSNGDATQGVGGALGSGGATTTTPQATGGSSTGGSAPTSTGGASPTGGTNATGGTVATGGSPSTGGAKAAGGSPANGGSLAMGGSPVTGGTSATLGGSNATGGVRATGGASTTGGSKATGGSATTGGAATAGATSAGGAGDVKPSTGCGKTPTLKNSPTSSAQQNSLSGSTRQFLIRWPTNYDNNHPYRLILGFHGAGGKDTDIAPSYFGLFDLSNNSTIFVAPSANGGMWNATADLTFVDDILKAVEADLCIDTSRVMLEGFSQGGAMVATLACARPGVFRAAVGHSRGGLTAPSTCQPIPYLGSLGLGDISGNSQATQTDAFAKWNGCTVTTMPLAPTGSHVCTNYTGCPAADPVIFCSFDGPHTASPTDSGKSTSWMPQQVWSFLSPI